MYLEETSHYLPELRIPNSYFENINGLTEDWIYSRTGIKTRSKAAENENTNTMAIDAVKSLKNDLSGVDLIIGASYTPYDTVATIAHEVQKHFKIAGAKAIYLSSACSSLINAVEIVEGYFALNKCKKALIIASEHNTAYSNEHDEKSGHLWGDGACALLITKDEPFEGAPKFCSVVTGGLGDVGEGPEAVFLRPAEGGLLMPNGRDVFINACGYMEQGLHEATEACGFTTDDLDYVIPHQANNRIIKNLRKSLKLPKEKIFSNIKELGNTGCASTGICLSQNIDKIKKGNKVAFTVFGGGYSYGAAVLQF